MLNKILFHLKTVKKFFRILVSSFYLFELSKFNLQRSATFQTHLFLLKKFFLKIIWTVTWCELVHWKSCHLEVSADGILESEKVKKLRKFLSLENAILQMRRWKVSHKRETGSSNRKATNLVQFASKANAWRSPSSRRSSSHRWSWWFDSFVPSVLLFRTQCISANSLQNDGLVAFEWWLSGHMLQLLC